MWAFYLLIFVLLGLATGSFLNLISDRLPRGESILWPASHCDSCQKPLGFWDLVPVFSYLWLRGRCRYCRHPMSPRMPLVELTSGLLFGLLYWHFEVGAQLGVALAYTSLLITIFVIDLEHGLVLNRLTYPGMGLALALSPLWPDLGPARALAGGGVGLALMLAPFLLSRGGMGMGDVKLGALLGLMTGYPRVFVVVLLSVVAGGAAAALLLGFRAKGRRDAIPFAPFLTTSAMVTLVWGESIWDWYTGFLGL